MQKKASLYSDLESLKYKIDRDLKWDHIKDFEWDYYSDSNMTAMYHVYSKTKQMYVFTISVFENKDVVTNFMENSLDGEVISTHSYPLSDPNIITKVATEASDILDIEEAPVEISEYRDSDKDFLKDLGIRGSKKAAKIIDISKWDRIGGQRGSNEGGLYQDQEGQEWYVKFPDQEGQARSEVIASKLYKVAGIRVPDVELVNHNGRLGVASKWVHGLEINPKAVSKSPDTWKGFGVDVLIANWDVVGLAHDNLLVDTKGNAYRIDPGGALEYRAQGGLKGKHFGDIPSEIDSLRDPEINPESASIFSKMSDKQIIDSLSIAANIPDNEIIKITNEYRYPKLATKLIKRKEWIKKFIADKTSGKKSSLVLARANAYGGVVFNDQGEVLLREPSNHFGGYVWTFPKGRQDKGESPEQTALREVKEETGADARIVQKIPGTFAGETSDTEFFLMTLVSGDLTATDWETQSVTWANEEQAKKLINETHSQMGKTRDLAVLDAAYKLYNISRKQSNKVADEFAKTPSKFLKKVQDIKEIESEKEDRTHHDTNEAHQKLDLLRKRTGLKLDVLGRGSSRLVARISSKVVLKLALNNAGREQNKHEYSVYEKVKDCSIITRIFYYDPDWEWLICEKALRRAEETDFRVYGSKNLSTFINNALYDFDDHIGKHVDKIAEKSLYTLVHKLGVDSGDLEGTSQWGLVERKGQKYPVLVDYGLSEDIYQEFYVWSPKKSRLLRKRSKIELDWDPQTRRDLGREESRTSDKVFRDLKTYVQQLKSQFNITQPLKDVFNSNNYNIKMLGNKLRSAVENWINTKSTKEKTYFKEQYGSNITDLLYAVDNQKVGEVLTKHRRKYEDPIEPSGPMPKKCTRGY